MNAKTITISYWTLTILFCLANLFSGIGSFFPNEQGAAIMAQLGYPLYINIILGVAKILGALAILQTFSTTLKEWAYAGFTFDYLGAALSFFFIGAYSGMIFPFVFLLVLFLSYFFWKKRSSPEQLRH